MSTGTTEPRPQTNQPPHSWRCDCTQCRRHRKAYRVEHDHGIRRLVDAEPARAHIARLAEQGVGRSTLGRALGLADLTLMRISNGKTSKVRVETERKILAFTKNDAVTVANDSNVDATASHLRYQALIALGYTQAWIAAATGRAREMGLGPRITRRRALALLELCRQVGDTPGPSRKAAVQAKNKGWRPPADFDEDLFYSPAWDGTEPEDRYSPGSRLSHVQEYDFLHEPGVAVADVARQLGVSKGYLADLLSRRDRGLTPFALSDRRVS